MKGFVLSSKLKETGVPFPNIDNEGKLKERKLLHNHFELEVHRMNDGKLAVRRKFDWYDSYANMQAGKTAMTQDDMKYAFKAVVEDAISGTMEFEDFCSEYGYDEDSRRAEKIHNECKKTLIKVVELGFNQSDLSDVVNNFSELGIE